MADDKVTIGGVEVVPIEEDGAIEFGDLENPPPLEMKVSLKVGSEADRYLTGLIPELERGGSKAQMRFNGPAIIDGVPARVHIPHGTEVLEVKRLKKAGEYLVSLPSEGVQVWYGLDFES